MFLSILGGPGMKEAIFAGQHHHYQGHHRGHHRGHH